ncbi:PREDICTED: coiled-coil domain-containing protein 115 isoform X2 [Nicotiana attenuata]|uniref:coiled-coil domain-containing protein 115 isoform X2 n=1 Tax=Nicotiana attenuata TaxID=49451 RepID=UPI000905110C|nr:PREDICTED: coiled-coil domain-containing protein 115 isoform X2 [Nicotiana attenuata]
MAKVEVAEMQSSVHENDKNVLEFMDSTDSYLVLMNSLSSSLRQGWFELASARHSMGASRINSALFDLKSHSAATTLQLNNLDAGPELEKLHFSLCKWASSESPKSSSEEAKFEEDKLLQRKSSSPKVLKQDGSSNSVQEEMPEATESPRTVDDQARKERLKSLSMFGMLVSPKLRAAQLSFETALETLVEVANKRADLLNAYDQVREKMETTTK